MYNLIFYYKQSLTIMFIYYTNCTFMQSINIFTCEIFCLTCYINTLYKLNFIIFIINDT